MQSKKKILILYNRLFHYRIPIFNILSTKYDLTVAYSFKTTEEELQLCNFKTLFLPITSYWKFVLHKDNIHNICQEYDVVIAYGQISWLSYSSLSLKSNRKYKLIFWSIGVPASYSRRFDDENYLYTITRDFFRKRSDGLIFYTDYPVAKHINRGFDKNKLFIANNTVKVDKIDIKNSIKDSIVFIGTLYLEKGLLNLLNAYNEAFIINNKLPKLNIIGGGKEFEIINNWISSNKLIDNIKLLGPIYDDKTKSEIFKNAFACISPNQAGLSVLESMGYGVPFITTESAITGGEIFNITNNKTGRKIKNLEELKDVILDITNNPQIYVEMGINAFNYYWSYRTPENMANGIIEAIETV